MLQQEPGLVSEAKTKTYNIHAQKHNDIRGIKSATKLSQKTGKRKHMLVLLGLKLRVCITEAFLFYGTEVQWTKW